MRELEEADCRCDELSTDNLKMSKNLNNRQILLP